MGLCSVSAESPLAISLKLLFFASDRLQTLLVAQQILWQKRTCDQKIATKI